MKSSNRTACFSSASPAIRLRGGAYSAIDTGDGYFLVKNVPIFSEVKKGTKGAPKDIGKKELEEYVAKGQERYFKGNFAATAFIRHNDDRGIQPPPEFVGYVLPTGVGKYKHEDGEKWTIFADIKMKAAAFERAKRGELPYHSPELPWKKGRISGLAFLDTEPPYFEFENFTIGEVVEDHAAAHFNQDPELEGNFMADEDKKKDEEAKAKMAAASAFMDDLEKSGKAKYKCGKYEAVEEKEPEKAKAKAKMQESDDDPAKKKGDSAPAEAPKDDKMKAAATIEMAKFALLEDKIADLEAKEKAREDEKAANVRFEAASRELAEFDLGEKTKAGLFAAAKSGDDAVETFIAVVKENGKRRPPSNVGEFEAGCDIDPNDEDLKEFSSPKDHEIAVMAAREYDQLKADGQAQFMRADRKTYVMQRVKGII